MRGWPRQKDRPGSRVEQLTVLRLVSCSGVVRARCALDLWDTTAWGEIPPDERLITQLGVADAVLFDGFERTRRYRESGGPSAAQAVFEDDQPDYCDGAAALGIRTFCIDRAGRVSPPMSTSSSATCTSCWS
jgi:hypothetical protein